METNMNILKSAKSAECTEYAAKSVEAAPKFAEYAAKYAKMQ
jgi:hypothetical protein